MKTRWSVIVSIALACGWAAAHAQVQSEVELGPGAQGISPEATPPER